MLKRGVLNSTLVRNFKSSPGPCSSRFFGFNSSQEYHTFYYLYIMLMYHLRHVLRISIVRMAASYCTLPTELRQAIYLLALQNASPEKNCRCQHSPPPHCASALEKTIYAVKHINKKSFFELVFVLDHFLRDKEAELFNCIARIKELNVQYRTRYPPNGAMLPYEQREPFQALVLAKVAARRELDRLDSIVVQVERASCESGDGRYEAWR